MTYNERVKELSFDQACTINISADDRVKAIARDILTSDALNADDSEATVELRDYAYQEFDWGHLITARPQRCNWLAIFIAADGNNPNYDMLDLAKCLEADPYESWIVDTDVNTLQAEWGWFHPQYSDRAVLILNSMLGSAELTDLPRFLFTEDSEIPYHHFLFIRVSDWAS